MSSFRRTSIILLCVSLFVAVSSTQRALADPWGSQTETTGAHPDGGNHTWCTVSLSSTDITWLSEVSNSSLGNQTDAFVVRELSCDLDSGTETDVVWRADNLEGSVRGKTFCEDYDNGFCDQSYAYIDFNAISDAGGPYEANVKKTMCHELGHSVGLSHGTTYGGCMVSGKVTSDLSYRRYASHHVAHVNDWF